METVRKTKAPTTPETDAAVDETLTPEVCTVAVEAIEEIKAPDIPQPNIKDAVAEAPELFGHSPTAQEIEEFKQKELVWRAKLRQL